MTHYRGILHLRIAFTLADRSSDQAATRTQCEKGIQAKKMLRLLCITAHPDDEAGGFGGTLLHYAQRGVETHVLCLTPGQAATHRGGAKSDDELAQIRRREFAASCK